MRAGQSTRMAQCGVCSALSVVILCMGQLIPLATYCAPALAALLLLPILEQYGIRTAGTMYLAVSLLAVLLVPDRELSLLYMLVLGYVPILHRLAQRLRWRWLRSVALLAAFQLAVVACYWLLLNLFTVPGLSEELGGASALGLAALFLLGDVSFFLYTRSLDALTLLCRRSLRKRKYTA